jgi:hypothetical protein
MTLSFLAFCLSSARPWRPLQHTAEKSVHDHLAVFKSDLVNAYGIRWHSALTASNSSPRRRRDRKGLGRSSVGRKTKATGRSHLRADLPPGAPATLRALRIASLRAATKLDRGRLGLTKTERLQVFRVNNPSQASPLLWRARTQLARFGSPTPTRARGLFDASVDQTEARKATV